MPFQTGGAAGVTTLSDLDIDVDKDWEAHDINYLGDLTPKVDEAYNLGSSSVKFDTAYANNLPPYSWASDGMAKDFEKSGLVPTMAQFVYNIADVADGASVFDNANLSAAEAADITYNSNLQLVKEASIFDDANLSASKAADIAYDSTMVVSHDASLYDHSNLSSPKAADITYQTEMKAEKAASIFDHGNLSVSNAADIAYQSELQPVKVASIFDHDNLSVSRGADIAYQPELMPVKFADVFDHSNLGSAKARDIVYHANFNLPSTEARDKVAESTYGMAADQTGVKGISKQVTEKKDFAFRTETPNHAYWHRMYNTPAAFETVYQDYTTSMQKKGTTPSKSAPNTADPNPQPGAMWSVAQVPDGTEISNFGEPAAAARAGVAFDGQYLLRTSYGAGTIYKLKKDGTVVDKIPGQIPKITALAWDGEYIWHAGLDADWIYQQTTDGTLITGYASPAPLPAGLAWDGTYLWSGARAYGIYKLLPDGTIKDRFSRAGARQQGLGWDGKYLWSACDDSSTIYQLKRDGTVVSKITKAFSPNSAGWDGSYLWTCGGGHVYQLGNAGNFDANYRIFAK